MKTNIVLAAIMSLFVLSMAVSAQKAPDFSGTWNLDVSKSKLGDRNSIESQTMTVTQTATDIKVETATKRTPPPAGAPSGGPPGGGRMGGGFGGGGDIPVTYKLDGKETTVEVDSPMGKMPVKYTGKLDGSKLILASSRTFSGQMGEITMTNKESWELSTDGLVLTISGERTTPRGTDSTTKIFIKKP
jgi:hypothetical protein